MLRKISLNILGTVFLCLSAVAASNNDKPKDIPGCHPLLTIRGSDGEPFYVSDCTTCIDCASSSGNTCGATAICSADPVSCIEGTCPRLNCSCTNDSHHIGCDCECSGSGVDCTWTDNFGFFHEITKDCPDHLP
jgi:hypothetical protein